MRCMHQCDCAYVRMHVRRAGGQRAGVQACVHALLGVAWRGVHMRVRAHVRVLVASVQCVCVCWCACVHAAANVS